MERPISARALVLVSGAYVVILLVFLARLFWLQVVAGDAYAAQSEENRLRYEPVFAERGVIYDRRGVELAWNVPNPRDVFAMRSYTATSGFAHVLGYVALPRRDARGVFHRARIEGIAGAEKIYDRQLAGSNGLKIVETNAVGAVQTEGVIVPPRSGTSMTLTIDARIQEQLFSFLRERAEEGGFRAGAGVIMDVRNGDLIALTNYPEYDPNALVRAENATAIRAFRDDPRKVFLNRAVRGLYTPGSVIKPFVALAALREGIIDPRKTIVSTGALVVPNPYDPAHPTVFKDWKAHGPVDMERALAVSSNVYFFEIGGGFGDQEGLGIARIEKYARLFGLAQSTGSVLDPEDYGVIPSPRWKEETFGDPTWRVGDTYNTSIGQYGFLVTPLQVVRAVAAIASEGSLVRPRLSLLERKEQRKLPFTPEQYQVVKRGMRRAVTEGTTRALDVPWVAVAGKTGTAEVGRKKEFMNSWVVGFFPYENPRYAFAVVMEKGPAGTLIGAPYVMYELLRWMKDGAPEYLAAE